ncbi:MAG: hypothetical protein WBZ37_22395 [Mycobacterium sp.]
MRKFVVAAEAAGALTAAALGLAATAAANPDTADIVVSSLQSQGYSVQVVPPVPDSLLPQCSVTKINPSNLDRSASYQEKQHISVEVDVSCPSN